jgi:hypothetical protein
MARDWIMVRIDPAVHAQLERVRASMLVGEMMGQRTLEHDPRHRVSLSQVIAQLIAFRDKHAERARRAKEKRRKLSASTNLVKGQGGEAERGVSLRESETPSLEGGKGNATNE